MVYESNQIPCQNTLTLTIIDVIGNEKINEKHNHRQSYMCDTVAQIGKKKLLDI